MALRAQRRRRFGAAHTPPPGGWAPSQLIRAVVERALPRLPAPWAAPQVRLRGWLAQLSFGEPRQHYEVWYHGRSQRVEVGLHLEADAATNQRLLAYLDGHLLPIKAALGAQAELEPWDRGWVRLYETLPAERLDETLAERVATRLAAYVAVLQPLLDDAPPAAPHRIGAARSR